MTLIDESTGQIDPVAFSDAVTMQAIREWGGPNFPPRVQRSAKQWVQDRADAERRQWRRYRNLPVPGEEVLVRGFQIIEPRRG